MRSPHNLCRLFALLLTAVLVSAAAASEPAAEEPSGQPIVLSITGLWGDCLPGKEPKTIEQKATRAVLEDFLKRNPDISFATNTGLKLQGTAQEAGFMMAMAGGSAGQIIYVNFRSAEQFVRQNFLYPLDEYILDMARERRGLPPGAALTIDEIKPEELDIYPQIWEVICRTGDDGKRHVYAFPYNPLAMCLQYRKDLFREAGLDPSRPPRTWDELVDFSVKLTDPAKGTYGFAMMQHGWHFMDFLWQGGSEVVTQDDSGAWRAVFNDPPAVNTLRFLRRFFHTNKTARDPANNAELTALVARLTPDFQKDFEERRVAMIMSYTGEFLLTDSTVQPEILGLAPLPAGPGGSTGEFNAKMWGMNSQITSKRERDAAWKFIRDQGSEDARRIMTRIYVQGGYANFVNPALLKKFGYEDYLDRVSPEWVEANAAVFKRGKPEPYGKNCQAIYNTLSMPIDQVALAKNAVDKAKLEPGSKAYDEDTRWLQGVLDSAVQATNQKLLGIIPKEQLERQRTVSLIVVGVIAIAFLFAIWRFALSFGAAQPLTGGGLNVRTWRHHLQAWSFLVIAVLSIGLWMYYPLLKGSTMAFQDYRVLGGSQWVGMDNFIEAYNQDDFWTGIRVTCTYVALSLGLGFFVPIVLALMLHEVPRGKVFFRLLYYLPAVITGLITMFLWKSFYDPSPAGMLNQLLTPLGAAGSRIILVVVVVFIGVLLTGVYRFIHESLLKRAPNPGLAVVVGFVLTLGACFLGWNWVHGMWTKHPPYGWLTDPDTALLCVILPDIWAGAGPGCLIYLAALKAIPEEIYEAADLDGAGVCRKVWNVVLPSLKPLIIINFVGAFIGAFHAMQNIFVMSGSGPLNSTHTLSLEIWMSAFLYLKYGYATAIAWILGAFLIGFTVWQLRILRDMRFTTAK